MGDKQWQEKKKSLKSSMETHLKQQVERNQACKAIKYIFLNKRKK